MTKDDICKWMHMAWNSASEENLKRKFEYHEGDYLPYERFAQLVAEHEREACALICDEVANKHHKQHYPDLEAVADECAGAIRANRSLATTSVGNPNYRTPQVTPQVTPEVTGGVEKST